MKTLTQENSDRLSVLASGIYKLERLPMPTNRKARKEYEASRATLAEMQKERQVILDGIGYVKPRGAQSDTWRDAERLRA